jgi:pyruvate/2-oxoglutarate dehydrogenase complex dihydrolipoamide acyltransferase (E2) component
MQELKLPKRGQAMEEGQIVEWTVDEGEPVSAGDPVVLFETDKATEELVAERDGLLLAKSVDAGDTVPIGTALGYVGTDSERDALPTDEGTGPNASETDPDERAAQESDGAGETRQEADEQLIRSSPSARRVAREHGVAIETVARELGIQQVRDGHVEQYASRGETSDGPSVDEEVVRGSPAARRIAQERGLDVSTIGAALDTTRVRMDDVEEYVDRHATDSTEREAEETAPPVTDGTSGPSIHEEVPVTGTRGVMYDRMREVATEYASTTTVARVDVTELMSLIDSLVDPWETHHSVSPSLTAFVVRAVAESLPEYRMLNAEVVDSDEPDEPVTVRQFSDVNVGVAVDTDHGLLVPTVDSADGLSVRELGREITRLAEAARNRELGPEGMQGGTFTVSNAGTFGAYINTPQINPPQTGILGMCTVTEEAGVIDGDVVPRQFMHLCLTYDHRVIEGATAVQFLQAVSSRLEEPGSLLS